jgi:putative transposase
MPRTFRTVAVGYPHHVTQRGNNREQVFFDDQDRRTYLDYLNKYAIKYQIDIWAYCLMSSHIHMLAVPQVPESLAFGIGLVNQNYTRYINRKYLRSGRVWQNRFFSCIVDTDEHLWAVARYIENNPVKAVMVADALGYKWSSAKYHLIGEQDSLMERFHWLKKEDRGDYRLFLSKNDESVTNAINQATRSGRPYCGSVALLSLENIIGRCLC